MISWIQRNFQHHFKLIFVLVLVGLGIPFVVTIGSTPGLTQPDRKAKTADFFGYNLESEQDKSRIFNEAHLSAELQFGGEPSPEQVTMYGFQRIAALHLADVMHIPPANPSELPDFIKNLRMFAGQNGVFDVTRYDQFRKNLGSAGGVSEAEISHVLADDVRAQKIEPLLGGPGYVLPGEVGSIIKQGGTSWTISTATVDYSAFDPAITLTDADIAKYFSNNAFRYTIAPRVAVEAINFFSLSYLAQVTKPSDAQIRQFYDANPGRFPNTAEKPAPGKPAVKPNPEADFAAVKSQVMTTLELEEAKKLALKAGSDFAYGLYEGKVTRGASLDAYISAHKLTATPLTPFTKDAGPAEFGGSRPLANAAFELNADRYYSDALPTNMGATVLIWQDSLPVHEPALAEVKDKVRADAYDDAKQKRFSEFGMTLRAGIENRLKEGDSFENAATEAASPVKIAVKSYPAFKYSGSPKDLNPRLVEHLLQLPKGAVSPMETTEDNKGVVIYVQDRTEPAVDASSKQYAILKGQMAQVFARDDSLSLLSSLVETEHNKAEPNTR